MKTINNGLDDAEHTHTHRLTKKNQPYAHMWAIQPMRANYRCNCMKVLMNSYCQLGCMRHTATIVTMAIE